MATSKDSPASTNSNNFGVGLVFGSNGNTVEENKIGGNVNGVYIDANGDVGNVIRRNVVMGNPPGQVSTDYGSSIGADIQDMSTPGANIFEDNRCLTYAGAAVPAPCPSVANNDDFEARYGDSMSPNAAIAQADVGSNNLGGGTLLASAAALLLVGLVVPKDCYRNLKK